MDDKDSFYVSALTRTVRYSVQGTRIVFSSETQQTIILTLFVDNIVAPTTKADRTDTVIPQPTAKPPVQPVQPSIPTETANSVSQVSL